MMKTGHVEKTIDRDYEVEERRFRTLEAAANRLQKEAKGYLDALRGTTQGGMWCNVAMTAAQTRIAETIDAFYGEAGPKDNVSAYYRQAVEDLDAETVKELVFTVRGKRVTGRMGRIGLVLLIRFRGFVLTFRISTRRLRSGDINFLIMILFGRRLSG
jgi:BAR domain